MNELEEVKIENMIYEIRGKHVMLDRDLAKLYGVETRTLIQKVKRNIERFPSDFCFQMSADEFENWTSQIVMSKNDKKGLRRPPYVFTEEGVAMLSAILKSSIAVSISIKIIKAFVHMRRYININTYNNRISIFETKYLEHDMRIDELFDKLEGKELKNEIYFEGQIYDSYSKIVDIMSKAKEELIIIDGYADKVILDMIKNLNIKVILITKRRSLLSKLDIEKYNSQYNNLKVIYSDTFHDRYFILDKSIVYHCGTSINHIGSKIFSINKMEEDIVINSLMHKVNELNR